MKTFKFIVFFLVAIVCGTVLFYQSRQQPAATVSTEQPQFVEVADRMPSSTEDDEPSSEVTENRVDGVRAVNSLLDDGKTVHKVKDDYFKKYGEFFVEVVEDGHSDDVPAKMNFYVLCKDNRSQKNGTKPKKEKLNDEFLKNLRTCDAKSIDFKFNSDNGMLSVEYAVDVRNKENKRDFCDEGMAVDLSFPEVCAQWNK